MCWRHWLITSFVTANTNPFNAGYEQKVLPSWIGGARNDRIRTQDAATSLKRSLLYQ